MINWLDQKYILLVSHKLNRFKKIGNNFNFRCPHCGDSKKSKTKARGWLFHSKDDALTRFFCHNCNESSKFPWFLKFVDQNLYLEYIKEKFSNEDRPKTEVEIFADKMKVPKFRKETALNKLKKISSLDPNHIAKKYVMNRHIPSKYHYRLFYCENFKRWINSIIPNKFESLKNDEPRLIIPLLDENKDLIGIQGRSFKSKTDLKYITIMLNEESPKMFGLDDVDKSLMVKALEGPIDAMFISNSVASCGGKIESNLSKANIKDCCIIYDAEYRSKHTIKKMEDSIEAGYSICIWPENILNYGKDVNEFILAGISIEKLNDIINSNIYSGLEAKLRLTEWKKI